MSGPIVRTARCLVGAVVASVLLAVPAAQAQPRQIAPVRTVEPRDDAAGAAGFAQFRRDVRSAAASCTEASLRRILASTASSNHPTMPPSRAFWHYWKVEAAGGLPGLCRVFTRAIDLGAIGYGTDVYCVPYVSCVGGPPAELPLGVYLVGVAERVELRAQPSNLAPVLAHARYPVLVDCRGPYERCGPTLDDPPAGWWLARLDATVGYVADAQIRDQIEPTLIVSRLRGGWRITALEFYD